MRSRTVSMLTLVLGVTALLGVMGLGVPAVRGAESGVAPAAARRVGVKFRPADRKGRPRDELRLEMRLSLTDLDPGLIASQQTIAVTVGATRCVTSEPNDGGRWKRLRRTPWVWKGVLSGTEGCAGKARVKLDLRSGAFSLRLARVALGTLRDDRPEAVPIRLDIGADTFLCHVDFRAGAKRWDHRDPHAVVPVEYAPPETDPGTDPDDTDGPVAHRVLRSGALYREDPHPALQVIAVGALEWRQVWERDWQASHGPTLPDAGFPEKMVVTFAGASGLGIEGARFERSGNDLTGYVTVIPYAPSGGYQPSMRVFAAFEVPRVTGRVTFRTQIGQDPGVFESDCPLWQPGW